MDKKTIIALIFVGIIFLLWPLYMKKVVGVNTKPVIHQNAIPQNNGTVTEVADIRLDWSASSASAADTIYYDLYFGTIENSLELEARGLLESEYHIKDRHFGMTYYWQVIASNSKDETIGPLWKFNTKKPEIIDQGSKPPTRGDTNPVGANPDTVVIETDIFKGKLSTLGGGTVISWKLKNYLKPEIHEDLNNEDEENWVELMPIGARGDLGMVLGVDMSNKVFSVEYDTLGEYKSYRFTHVFGGGGKVIRTFRIVPNSYSVDFEVRLVSMTRGEVGENYSIQWNSGLSPTEGEKRIRDDNMYYLAWAMYGNKDKLYKSKNGEAQSQTGNSTKWIALRTKYFAMALIPISEPGSRFELNQERGRIYKENDWKTLTATLDMPFRGSPEETSSFKLYMGPMDHSMLKSQGYDLHKIMFGKFILKPISTTFFFILQAVLKFIFGIVQNYGWAIIIFSILIKIVLYPLTRKSFQSMKAMQELQPKVAALKEKHKNDSQKLNQETMKLYKQHGVNPMGGCLPMLLQMPVLITLFTLFRTTIMLRQASFLAIKDLSAPDAIFGAGLNLLPILMGITMIIQQKLSTTSPQQKAMAYMMPIFFAFIFYKMSAGLNLYYLMFNLLTIGQELLIKKKK
jgi:YidC/Oxa1 family membrane protein insertase